MNKVVLIGYVLATTTMLSACAEFNKTLPKESITEPAYIEAAPVPEVNADPAVVTVYKTMPMPGQLKALPAEVEAENVEVNGTDVVELANQSARQNPDEMGFYNSVMRYVYDDGALYQVYSAPLRITDIQLQPGEKLMGIPAAGDTSRWIIQQGRSMVKGEIQEHIYIKPIRAGLETTLAINTDRRTYIMELHSYKKTYMAAISWSYPLDEVAMLESLALQQEAKSKQVTDTNVNLNELNFDYEIAVDKGDEPSWKPVKVFDDGRKTYIQFPPAMLVREAPVLFIRSGEGETQLVNYRMKNEYYIVDRLFEDAELRVGEKNQTIVRIKRSGEAFAWFESKPYTPSKSRIVR